MPEVIQASRGTCHTVAVNAAVNVPNINVHLIQHVMKYGLGKQEKTRTIEKIREKQVDPGAPPLFETQKDEYLLSLGVPESWIPALREIRNDDQLLEACKSLPEEVQERFSQVLPALQGIQVVVIKNGLAHDRYEKSFRDDPVRTGPFPGETEADPGRQYDPEEEQHTLH